MSAGCELRRLNFSDDLFSEYAQSAPGTDGPVDTDLNRHEETTACTHDRGRTVSYYRSTWIATLGWCSSFAPASIAGGTGLLRYCQPEAAARFRELYWPGQYRILPIRQIFT